MEPINLLELRNNILIMVILIFSLPGCDSQPNTHNEYEERIERLEYSSKSMVVARYLNSFFDYYGMFPSSLDELKSFVLEDEFIDLEQYEYELRDPFSEEEEALIYRLIHVDSVNRDCILYSIGPDGVDNNAEEIDRYNKNPTGLIEFLWHEYVGKDHEFSNNPENVKGDIIIVSPVTKNEDILKLN